MKENIRNAFKKDYTLNDIIVGRNHIFFMLPAFLFVFSPLLEFFLYSAYFDEHILAWEFTYPAIFKGLEFFGFLFLVVGVIGFLIKNRGDKHQLKAFYSPVVICFAVFLTVAVLATLLQSYNEIGKTALNYLNYVIAEFLIYFFSSYFISKRKHKKAIVYTFILTVVIMSILAIINETILTIPIFDLYGYVCAVFYTPNYYGYYLAIAIMLNIAMLSFETTKREKIFLIVSFVINSVVFAMVNCYGTFLACIAGFVFTEFICIIKNRKFNFRPLILFVSFLLICFVVGLKYPSFFSDIATMFNDMSNIAKNNESAADAGTGRWGIWMATIDLIKQKPLFGYGAGGITERLYNAVGINAAHNEYMQYAADYGIPAALVYMAGLVLIFLKSWKNRQRIDAVTIACLIASFTYMVSAMFGNNVFYVGPFFYIFLGLSVNCAKTER